jgi:glyoxalase/bleomycin resistance protein/dioxygenase superfamily protein
MRFLRCLAVCAVMAGSCLAQLPEFYKRVNRVTWLVKNLDTPLQGWTQLGLSEVHEIGDITLDGQYRGKPVSVAARAATGYLGNLTVDMLQPAQGDNAFSDFLSRHGDGIFSIVHEVATMEDMTREIDRMRGLGVGVLQQITVKGHPGPITLTFFDTEGQGKYVLGLIYWPGGAPPAGPPGKISHIAFVVREAEGPSAYWQKLGLPAMPKSHASPREDSRYHGKPLWLDFDVCWQRHTQFTYEWIIPPVTPPNLYADFLKVHGEGIQHLGVPVDDLERSIAEYQKLGYSVAQSGAWGETGKKGSGRYAYMDTDAIGGVVAEVIRPIN